MFYLNNKAYPISNERHAEFANEGKLTFLKTEQ